MTIKDQVEKYTNYVDTCVSLRKSDDFMQVLFLKEYCIVHDIPFIDSDMSNYETNQ